MAPQQKPSPAPDRRHVRQSTAKAAVLVLGFVTVLAAGVVGWFGAHRSAARRAARAHHLETAQHHLDALLRFQRQSRALRFEAARIARRRGAFDVATSHLAKVAEKTPGEADVQLEHRLQLAQRGELQNVEVALRSFLARGHADASLIEEALAAGYLLNGRVHEAQGLLEELLRREPQHAPALRMLGEVFATLGREDETLPLLRRAVQADPASSAAHLALAKSLLGAGFEREAAGHFEWVRSRRPHDPEVLLGLAEVRSNAGEPGAAEKLIDELLQHHPNHPGGLTERARLSLRHDRAAQAEELCRRALAAAPTDAMAWQVMANALHAQGREAEAARALENHSVLDGAAQQLRYLAGEMEERPDDPEVYVKISKAYARLNQSVQAEDYLQRALAIDPGNAAVQQLLQQMRQQDRGVNPPQDER